MKSETIGYVQNSNNGNLNIIVSEGKVLTVPDRKNIDVGELVHVNGEIITPINNTGNQDLYARFKELQGGKLLSALQTRGETVRTIRKFLNEKGFLEVETPILSPQLNEYAESQFEVCKSSEIVGYLPQSAQLYKQLLVLGGVEKYFQLSHCFRADIVSKDKQPEFTQVDVEMKTQSFEEIMTCAEDVFRFVMKNFGKTIPQALPILTQEEAVTEYITEKPYTPSLEVLWVIRAPLFVRKDERLICNHHPVAKPTPDTQKYLDTSPEKVLGESFDLIYKGIEIAGGDMRNTNSLVQYKILKVLGLEKNKSYGSLLKCLIDSPIPHGGFAFGLERLLMLGIDKKNIRDVFSFPK